MTQPQFLSLALLLLHLTAQTGLILRAILRPHREPASRIAWVLVILVFPVVGILSYLLLGEVSIGRGRALRLARSEARLPPPAALTPAVLPAGWSGPVADTPGIDPASNPGFPAQRSPPSGPGLWAEAANPSAPGPGGGVGPRQICHDLFQVGESISGFVPCGGNLGQLAADSDHAITGLVADIDAARDEVNLLFFIWLPDGNGTRVAEALMRAAGRGITCRAMADDLGSRLLIHSPLWRRMEAAGVRLVRAFPTGNPLLCSLLGPLRGRVDVRNHRKLAIIDQRITWCGSQNCADPAFTIKPRYAPWVDILVRFEGPIARQNQWLFASDWMAHREDDDLSAAPLPGAGQNSGSAAGQSRPAHQDTVDHGDAETAKVAAWRPVIGNPVRPGALTTPSQGTAREPAPAAWGPILAQAMGTGPTVRHAAMPEFFASLMFAARRDLTITTPYYVPNEAMQSALCACGRRGVKTRLILPARNDSWIVAAASRSYYQDLLEAGVEIHEFQAGLLHAKTLTLDGQISFIGSANMDRRSFDLNYENNVLIQDPAFTTAIRERQESYLAQSCPVTLTMVAAWPGWRRLWNNTIAMLGPVL